VLANRLTESGQHRVLLLEAGPSDWNPLVHVPIGWTQISYHPAFNWGNSTGYRASREVIVSAGAINSPQLIQLSGIGPADLLQQYGIQPMVELEGVCLNLKHHLGSMAAFQVSGVRTVWDDMNPIGLIRQFFNYVFHRGGLLSFPSGHVGAYFRSSEAQERPDIQLFGGERDEQHRSVMDRQSAVTAMIQHVRPESSGSVKITSASASDLPAIHANYKEERMTTTAMTVTEAVQARLSQAVFAKAATSPAGDPPDVRMYPEGMGEHWQPVHRLPGPCGLPHSGRYLMCRRTKW
jgi:choline dehydrogenase